MIKRTILEILENNSRVSIEDMAVMLGKTKDEVLTAIEEMEADKIICGYSTLINWDKTEKEFVTAMIEVKVTPQREIGFDKLAERIYSFDNVKAVYLMSGAYDLLIMMDGKNIKEISHFISSKLSTIDGVCSTATHFVLKKYKEHGVVIEKDDKKDERMIVTP
jgi:DNA-binding Lrp family transcriptional regulator